MRVMLNVTNTFYNKPQEDIQGLLKKTKQHCFCLSWVDRCKSKPMKVFVLLRSNKHFPFIISQEGLFLKMMIQRKEAMI